MSALEKTDSVVRTSLPMANLVKNDMNPNKMNNREFDLLVDNIERTGLTDPILVRPVDDGKYRIVGGHHRFDAAEYLGFEEVPVSIIVDPEFDDDAEKFQLTRMNIIRGKMDPTKFMGLYNNLSDRYSDEVMQDMMGFSSEAEFKNLIVQTRENLPEELKDSFDKASKEVKTIEDLAQLLNHLLSTYGETLDHGYMVLDFGGKDSLWIRMLKKDKAAMDDLCARCREHGRTLDSVMRLLLREVPDDILEAADEAHPIDDVTPNVMTEDEMEGLLK